MYFRVYDDLKRSVPYQELLTQGANLLVRKKDGLYLDAGCGTGNSTEQIAARLFPNGRVIGLDNSPEALTRAKEKYPALEFRFGDLDRPLPFPDNIFDGVWANNSLYLVADPRQSLQEIFRVLKPGGRLIMSNPKENSSSKKIFAYHLAKQKEIFEAEHSWLFGQVRYVAHIARAMASYALILPFELMLKHGIKIESRFWPADNWLQILEEVRASLPFGFIVNPPEPSYAGENHTIIVDRLPR